MVRPMHSVRQPGHPTQNYGPHPPRNMSQGVFMRGPRPSQNRNSIHRNSNNQSGVPSHVVGITNMPGNAGQSPVIFPPHHNANLNVARQPMFLANQHQVSSAVHPSPPQAPMYTVNNQMQQIQFSPQPGGPTQTQHYFSGYPVIAVQANMIPFASSPHAQMPFCYPPPQSPHHPNNASMNVNPMNATSNPTMIRAGNEIIPQVSYPGHTVSPSNISQNHQQVQQQQHQEQQQQQPKLKIRPNALLNIVDPHTGKNVAEDIYRSASTPSPAVAQPEKTPRCSVIRITHPNSVQQQPPQPRSKSSSRSGTPYSTGTSSTSGIASTRSSPTSTIIINTSDSPSPPSHGSCSSRSISPMITIQTGNGIMMTKCLTNDMIIPELENISDESAVNINDELVTDNSTEEKCDLPEYSEPEPVESVQSVSEEAQSQPVEEPVQELVIKAEEEHILEESKPVEEPVVEPVIQPPPPSIVEEVEVKPDIETVVKSEPEVKSKPEVQQKKVGKAQKRKKNKKNRNAQKERTSSEESNICATAKLIKKENIQIEEEKIPVQPIIAETIVPVSPEEQKQFPICEESPSEIPVIINGEIEPSKYQVAHVEVKIEPSDLENSNSIEPVSEKIVESVDETPKISTAEIVSVKIESVEQNEIPHQKAPEVEDDKQIKSTEQIDEVDNVAVKISCDPINIVITPASDAAGEETKVIDSIRGASEINFFVDEVSSNEESPAPTELDAVEEDVEDQLTITKEEITNDKEEEDKEKTEELESEFNEDTRASEEISNDEIKTITYVNSKCSARRIYDREALITIRDDPRCWVRPRLPDMDVTRKNIQKLSSRSSLPIPSKDHDHLFPHFGQSSSNIKGVNKRNSYSGKPRPPPTCKQPPSQPLIRVSLSLNNDVKLRETENAWKPTRMKKEKVPEDEAKTQALYKKVRSVLNKLTPEKFETLVKQIRELDIDTEQRLRGVINIVFQKAVDEPTFSVAYALMCKELSTMKVAADDTSKGTDVDFRRLIITCCQIEFEKSTVDEDARNIKVKEIKDCKDPEKKKELQMLLEEDDRRTRRKYLGNIKFIGEIFKQRMLMPRIIHTIICNLLQNPDEENLECLCKLLTTVGKIFEEKEDLDKYFAILKDLIQVNNKSNKKNKKISSRIRFMIQDVIELRQNKWIPRRNENNPKTMDQIQKEVETERIISEVAISKTPLMTPRKDDYGGSDDRDRDRDRRRGRGGSTSSMDGWSNVVSNKKQQPIDHSKLRMVTTLTGEEKFGSARNFQWGMGASATPNPPTTPNKFAALLDDMSNNDFRRQSMSASKSSREYDKSDYKSGWNENRNSRNDNRNSRNDNRMNLGLSSRDGFRDNLGRNNFSMMPPPMMPTFKRSTPPVSSSPADPRPTTPVDTPVNAPINEKPSAASSKPRKSDDELRRKIKSLIDECHVINDIEKFITNAMETIQDNFDDSSYSLFVEGTINAVLEKKPMERKSLSHLFAHMINNKIISLSLVQAEFEKVLEYVDDLAVDIPQIFKYLAEILSGMLETDAHPFNELKQTLAIRKSSENCGEFTGEILSILVNEKSAMWVTDRWIKSGLEWSDLVDLEKEKIDGVIKKFNLGFLCGDVKNDKAEESTTKNFNIDETCQHLLKLLKESNFDDITSWISKNVGQKSTLPLFVRTLVTSILETSIEAIGNTWRLNESKFRSLLPLITRYVDTNPALELQCLFAIQAYNHKLNYPQGVLSKVINALCEDSIISDNAYLEWEKNNDPAEIVGHAIAIKALTSFFTNLREPERDDSSD